MDYRTEAPQVLKDFLIYHEAIKSHSPATVDEYYLDLRNFFRFLKRSRGLVAANTPLEEISIIDVDLSFVGAVTINEVYEYLSFLTRDKVKNPQSRAPEYGLRASSRARKISAIRSFYKYLTTKARLLTDNPVKDLDMPKQARSLPHYLTLDESRRLLSAVESRNKERDYCILCIFLNCGLRISEIVGLNISDVRPDSLRVLGKGAKERIVYLNQACVDALAAYFPIRRQIDAPDTQAVFLSTRKTRMSRDAIEVVVKNTLLRAGLDPEKYSAHKLRHTAATLMLQNGVDIRTLQEVLGHDSLNTTQIYTHVDSAELRVAAEANPLANYTPNNE